MCTVMQSFYEEQLQKEGTLDVFRIDELDFLSRPVLAGSLSVTADRGASSVGYGATDGAARLSVLGELSENWYGQQPLVNSRLIHGSFRALRSKGRIIDPVSLCLPVGSTYDDDDEISWVVGTDYPSGEDVLIPLAAVAIDDSQVLPSERLFPAITNGMGAGDTLERAVRHGLLEIVQRDATSVAHHALTTGPKLILEETSLPLVSELRDAGIEPHVTIMPASVPGFVVAYATGTQPRRAYPHPLMATASGEAAGTDAKATVEKALMEYVASRSRKVYEFGPLSTTGPLMPPSRLKYAQSVSVGTDRATRIMASWLSRSSSSLEELMRVTRNSPDRVTLSDLPQSTFVGVNEDLASALQLLSQFQVAFVDVSPSESVRVVKVIAPGLEVETASHGRIGLRNARRLQKLHPGLGGEGEAPPGAVAGRSREGTKIWLSKQMMQQRVGELSILYREPAEHGVVAEPSVHDDGTEPRR